MLTVHPSRRHGFGLLELTTTLAFLVIVVGLMVSLARYVRAGSAERNTQQLLRLLEDRLARQPATGPAIDSEVETLTPPPADASEAAWAIYATVSNQKVRKLLATDGVVCDAWGNPLAYLPSGRRAIGTAPHDRPFCVSPGPDGRFLTQQDNLYSYEQGPTAPTP